MKKILQKKRMGSTHLTNVDSMAFPLHLTVRTKCRGKELRCFQVHLLHWGQIGDNSLDRRVVKQSTTFQHDNQSLYVIKWHSSFIFLRHEKFTIPRVCDYEKPKCTQITHVSQSTTFYCDFLLQTLYPYSSSFKLFFSVRKLSGKFHKSCVCLCALRGDFSPFFCHGCVGAL
jgi:hypothetical protein